MKKFSDYVEEDKDSIKDMIKSIGSVGETLDSILTWAELTGKQRTDITDVVNHLEKALDKMNGLKNVVLK